MELEPLLVWEETAARDRWEQKGWIIKDVKFDWVVDNICERAAREISLSGFRDIVAAKFGSRQTQRRPRN